MALSIDDIVEVIATASPEQIQGLRELVAPVTKLQRLQEVASTLASRVEDRISAPRSLVANFANRVHNGDVNAVAPTWEELVAAFQG